MSAHMASKGHATPRQQKPTRKPVKHPGAATIRTSSLFTKRHPIGTKPARRRAGRLAKASRRANRGR